MKPTPFIFLLLLLSLTLSCQVGFLNSRHRTSRVYKKVYVPSVIDSSTTGGNAGILTQAIRRRLAEYTDVVLTTPHKARWTLDVRILEKQVETLEASDDVIEYCDGRNPDQAIGGGYFTCKDITQKQATGEPTVSNMRLYVVAKAVDLSTGRILWELTFGKDEEENTLFCVLGDDPTNTADADCRIKAKGPPGLIRLDALKYHANKVKITEEIAANIASSIASQVRKLSN